LVGRLAQAEIRLVERMEKSESSQQEMRAAMARLFERMDRFIQGLEGDGHKPR
jgi:L-serine deaminase